MKIIKQDNGKYAIIHQDASSDEEDQDPVARSNEFGTVSVYNAKAPKLEYDTEEEAQSALERLERSAQFLDSVWNDWAIEQTEQSEKQNQVRSAALDKARLDKVDLYIDKWLISENTPVPKM